MHYKIRLDERIVPESIKGILGRLKSERGIVIKGGVARVALLEMLAKQGKNIDAKRLEIERNIKDLDLILIHWGTLPKSKELLLEKEQEIREKLGDVISNSVLLRDQDIEPIRGKIDKEGKIDENTIKKILATRDLTINEVALISEDGQWWLCYTKRCWRDSLMGVGMLNAQDARITRRDIGRIVPSNRGFYRLMKFWIEGKVEKIWLPQWQLEAHLLEMARRQNNGEIPLGANLGRYSLILAEQYRNANSETKRRWMKALNELGFTDLKSGQFDIFVQEQDLLDGMKNGNFQFESDLSFEQIIDRSITERAEREEKRLERKGQRNQCEHEFEAVVCEGCEARCKIQKCQKCTRYIVIKPEDGNLPCNEIFVAGDWKSDTRSLREFPARH